MKSQYRVSLYKQQFRTLFTKPITYTESRIIGYSPQQLYSIVSNISDYKQFVPYCIDSKIISKNPMLATLRVGFQNLFEETYSSRVSLVEDKKVEAIASNTTVFKTLKNKWIFEPLKRELYDHPLLLKYTETQNIRDYPLTRIDFLVQFEFQNVVYQQASDLFLEQNVKKMIQAFERRAYTLHGPPTRVKNK